MLPRTLPFSSLLKVRSKKVRLLANIGDRSCFDGLMLMSATALVIIEGEVGEATSERHRGGGRYDALLSALLLAKRQTDFSFF